MRDGLHEFLGCCEGESVVLGNLRGGRAGNAEGLAFAGKLRDQANGVSASRVDSSPGEKQIAYERIAKITFPIWMYVSVTGVVIYGMLYGFPRP